MKFIKVAGNSLLTALLMISFLATTGAAASKEDLAEKIRLLEIQIQELRELKVQKRATEEKELQCVQVTDNKKMCSCLAEALPQEVTFEQYVHHLVSTKENLKNESPPAVQQAVDASIAARKHCVNRGFLN
ncbi:MAG TPA: hypothetical protein VGJ93_05105 [Desulfuromonadaceae bacterium]|jgi:Tfp pilus assembly protein PilN